MTISETHGLKRSRMQFSLAGLLMLVTAVAIWLSLQSWFGGGLVMQSGAGIGRYGGGDSAWFESAREAVDEWVRDNGYTRTERPPWSSGERWRGDAWYVGNVEGATPLYIRVRTDSESISAIVAFRKNLGEFESCKEEEAEYWDLVRRLRRWWNGYQVEKGRD